jgi:hypothetical protein
MVSLSRGKFPATIRRRGSGGAPAGLHLTFICAIDSLLINRANCLPEFPRDSRIALKDNDFIDILVTQSYFVISKPTKADNKIRWRRKL